MNALDWKPPLPVTMIHSTCKSCTCWVLPQVWLYGLLWDSQQDFKLKTKEVAPLPSVLPNRAAPWQPGSGNDQSPPCLAVQSGKAGLPHRCKWRAPEQQGRDGFHSHPSLPSQHVGHSAAVFWRINIPEIPECQWCAQYFSKETLPPCGEILIWLIYSPLI